MDALYGSPYNGCTSWERTFPPSAFRVPLSRSFQSILGVEEWEPAVVDAGRNAELNGVENAHYQVGRVEQCIEELRPQLANAAIVVDPPRAGLHPKVAKTLSTLDAL